MSNEISTTKASAVSVIETHDLGDIIKPAIREIHLFDTFVAGTAHLKDTSVLDEIKIGDVLSLRREENKFDDKAILILYGTSPNFRELGYVPEKDNIIFSRLMDAGKLLRAKITDIKKYGSFSKIDISIFLFDI